MFAHGTPDPLPARGRINHESGVRDMVPQSRPVRSQNIAADNSSILFGNVSARSFREPVRHRFLTWSLWVVNEGVARRNGRLEDLPDSVAISLGRRADRQRTRKGRFHKRRSPPQIRKSKARCQAKLRYLLAW